MISRGRGENFYLYFIMIGGHDVFERKRYITKGVAETISPRLHNILWYIIDIMDVSPKDYLQIFKLDQIYVNRDFMQRITHIQKQPEYKKEHIINFKEVINEKIYIIDNGDYSTMLLTYEY